MEDRKIFKGSKLSNKETTVYSLYLRFILKICDSIKIFRFKTIIYLRKNKNEELTRIS